MRPLLIPCLAFGCSGWDGVPNPEETHAPAYIKARRMCSLLLHSCALLFGHDFQYWYMVPAALVAWRLHQAVRNSFCCLLGCRACGVVPSMLAAEVVPQGGVLQREHHPQGVLNTPTLAPPAVLCRHKNKHRDARNLCHTYVHGVLSSSYKSACLAVQMPYTYRSSRSS